MILSQKINAAKCLNLNLQCGTMTYVEGQLCPGAVAGVSNEYCSAAHFRRHRHNSCPQCSDTRIGPGSRSGQESTIIGPKSAADVPQKKARVLEMPHSRRTI